MKAKGHDLIWVVPPTMRLAFAGGRKPRVHDCAEATRVHPERRDALDPMALGECRLCQERLPR